MDDLSEAQRRELNDYLETITTGRRIQAHVYSAYKSWCKDNDKRAISAETLRLWVKKERRPTKLNSFYQYIAAENLLSFGDSETLLINSIDGLFKSGHADSHKVLCRLIGSYKITRRLWTPAHSDDFLECPAEFHEQSSGVIFTERQIFSSSYSIKEIYKGYTFLSGSSAWIIAHEENASSVRFMAIHECTPPLLPGNSPINVCKGTLIAVSGRGPNISHRFVLKRVSQPLKSCRIIGQQQLNLDMDDREYLFTHAGMPA